METLDFGAMERHGHDVYEFAYRYDTASPRHWQADSLYVDMDSMEELKPYLDRIFPAFAYYGPQRVTLEQWQAVRRACLGQEPQHRLFFDRVEQWLVDSPERQHDFWILGV